MTTPAGWYDDGSGRLRWWDGAQWTEHFAPDAAAQSAESSPADAAEAPSAGEQPAAASDAAAASDDTAVHHAPDGASQESAPVDDAPTAAFTAPVEPEPAPAPEAELPPYAAPASAPQTEAPAYGGVPSYPGASPAYGAAPAQPADPSAYPVAGAGYPAAAPSPAADGSQKPSVLGLVGLGLSVLGTILVFIPLIGAFGFVLLGVGFILSIVSLFLKGKKWPGIAGLSLAIVGTIIGVIMMFVYLVQFANEVDSQLDDLPSASSSESASEPEPEESGTAEESEGTGVRPTADEVAVGLTDIIDQTGQSETFPAETVTCIAGEFVANPEISDEALQTIAEGADALYLDNEALTAFSEAFPAATMNCYAG